ncbi:GNAT family N-acetyltransferase [Alkaliphilus serpentinus]|uniref:Acetyltransferase n=1 Tax=Alkaliphilus serpentinus TaxID=1482731 RepID=A0A833M8I0_9FIRM|nr:GNAT family N-acetyltransferase [Alkaliphilus serpentinus]KAB3525747.1 acetyltransferase [Alkaliphilus serpentinus]
MEGIYRDELITLRRMKDCLEDYSLLTKWLSDPSVAQYYEGKSKLYDMEKVLMKFGPYARGEERVIPCIIEYQNTPIGYIQYYKAHPDEYDESKVVDMTKYKNTHGADIIIGETQFWNKGIGTNVIQMMIRFLFENENADIIFIDPQTWNKRAIRCYEKSGFNPLMVAKNRELLDDIPKDSLIMAITAKDQPLYLL